jgi:hypothetical protein
VAVVDRISLALVKKLLCLLTTFPAVTTVRSNSRLLTATAYYSDDGSSMFLQNIIKFVLDYMTSHSTRQ